MEFSHIPIMLAECVDGLAIRPDGIYLDGTVGGAGHSKEIAKRLTSGHLYAIDQDPDAIETATARLAGLAGNGAQGELQWGTGAARATGDRSNQRRTARSRRLFTQLDDRERGFSYLGDAPLDMRMSQSGPTAADLVNTLDREELAKILREYGEEPCAWTVAGRIVAARAQHPIETTGQLAEIVLSAMRRRCAARTRTPHDAAFRQLGLR